MAKLWAIAKREYLERVRTRWFFIATFFGPLLFGGLMILPPLIADRSRASENVGNIYILDATGTDLGNRISGVLGGLGSDGITRVITLTGPEVAEAESLATDSVRASRARGYLVLDSRTVAGTGARYAGTNASTIADMDELTRIIREQVLSLRFERAGVDPLEASTIARTRVRLETERLTSTGRGGSGRVNILFAVMVATLLYFTIFLYGQNVLRGVMEEKQNRVAEVVFASVRPMTLLGGKVLGVGAVGLTQLVLWMLSAFVLYQIREPLLTRFGVESTTFPLPDITLGILLLLLLFFVLGYVFYAALFAAVGAMVNSEQEAQQAQLPVVLLLISSIVMVQTILSRPDGELSRVLSLLPFSSPVVMPLRMSIVAVPALDIAASILLLIGGCLAVVWIASRIYRVGMLMYGKRPTMGELLRWVRG
ncbi:MAG: ABC transporter permease [Gemmatimonadaceae bacterium]